MTKENQIRELAVASAPRAPEPGQAGILAPQWSEQALAALKFQRHPKKAGLGIKINNRWVMVHTVREAWASFWACAHRLDPRRIQKARELASSPSWEDKPRGERIAFGRCYRLFAEKRILPVELLNPEKTSNLKYRLNDNLEQAPTIH